MHSSRFPHPHLRTHVDARVAAMVALPSSGAAHPLFCAGVDAQARRNRAALPARCILAVRQPRQRPVGNQLEHGTRERALATGRALYAPTRTLPGAHRPWLRFLRNRTGEPFQTTRPESCYRPTLRPHCLDVKYIRYTSGIQFVCTVPCTLSSVAPDATHTSPATVQGLRLLAFTFSSWMCHRRTSLARYASDRVLRRVYSYQHVLNVSLQCCEWRSKSAQRWRNEQLSGMRIA